MHRFVLSFSAWVLAAGVVLVLGCEVAPQGEKELPTLREVNAGRSREHLAVQGERITGSAKVEAAITEVYLPLDASLESAWAVVDEDVFPAVTRGVWRGNGLRAGLLHESQLETFLDALPATLGEHRRSFVGYDQRSPLRRSPVLRVALFADLTVPPFAPRREPVVGHRLQLLAALQQRGSVTRVELTPHHYVPRLTLKPRSPLEKALDGRVFEELSVTVDVPGDRYLVLGLYRDPSVFPAEEGADEPGDSGGTKPGADAPQEGAGEEGVPAEPEPQKQSGVQVRGEEGSGDRERADDAAGAGGLAVVLLSEDATGVDGGVPGEAGGGADEAGGERRLGAVVDRRPLAPIPMHIGRGLFTQPGRRGDMQVLVLIRFSAVR